MKKEQSTAVFKRKLTTQTVLAFTLIVFGMIVVMLGLYLPPVGEIHASVIAVFGMSLVAAGTFIGIDLNVQLRAFLKTIYEIESKTKDDETD